MIYPSLPPDPLPQDLCPNILHDFSSPSSLTTCLSHTLTQRSRSQPQVLFGSWISAHRSKHLLWWQMCKMHGSLCILSSHNKITNPVVQKAKAANVHLATTVYLPWWCAGVWRGKMGGFPAVQGLPGAKVIIVKVIIWKIIWYSIETFFYSVFILSSILLSLPKNWKKYEAE